MRELEVNVLNDYEHLITNAIERHCDESGFPEMDANISRKELNDYLYEYQCILDSEGSQRVQLTKYGIIAVVPILIMSAFPEQMLPWRHHSLWVGLFLGIAIALLLKGFSMLSVRIRLSHLRKRFPVQASYSDKVAAYMKKEL